MNPIAKRVGSSLAGVVGLAAVVYAGMFVYIMMPPARSFSRSGEKLPAVFVENGETLYCRMRCCDFRLPLPAQAHIVRTNPVTGGYDTIDGAIYVVGPDGGPVDMRAYAELLQRKHFKVSPCDGSGCPEITNNTVDVPFVSGGKVIHFPLFDGFWAGKPDEGSSIEVSTEANTTKIRFGYFGDY